MRPALGPGLFQGHRVQPEKLLQLLNGRLAGEPRVPAFCSPERQSTATGGDARQQTPHWKNNPDLRADYRRPRPNIERVVSQVASRGGRRLKLRYRGTDRNNAWLKRRTAALNLRNLINRGLDYAAGWPLTTA
ncbi:hypothetical protein GCM10023080_067410 [Streptomyces pseudoechinosporeus]